MQLQDFGVDGAGKVAQVQGFAGSGNVLRAKEFVQRPEVLRIAAGVSIHLRHAQDGGHIAAVQRQGLLIAHLRQRIREVLHVIVSQHGQDGWGGVLLVECLQLGDALLLLAHGRVNVVPGAGDFFRGAALGLNIGKGGERFLKLFPGQVNVQQLVYGRIFVREGFDQALVLGHGLFRAVLHQVHAAQQTAVPEIGAVQRNCFFERFFRRILFLCLPLRLCQVIPHGVVVGGGYRKGLQDVPGTLILAVPVQGNGVD